jgi:hypothetical protein
MRDWRTGLLKERQDYTISKINISSRFGFKRKDRQDREGKGQGEDSLPRLLRSQNVKEPLRHGASARGKMLLYATRPSSSFSAGKFNAFERGELSHRPGRWSQRWVLVSTASPSFVKCGSITQYPLNDLTAPRGDTTGRRQNYWDRPRRLGWPRS